MKAIDHGRTHRSRARRLAALVCLAGLGLTAQAATTVPLSEQLTGWSPKAGGGWARNIYNDYTVFDTLAANRSWAGAGAGASARVIATDVASIAGRAGALPVSSSMAVGMGDAAAAVARCMLGANLVCAGATAAAAAAYAAYRVYNEDDGIPGLAADPGTSPVLATAAPRYQAVISPNTLFSSGSAQFAGETFAQKLIDKTNIDGGFPSSTRSKYTLDAVTLADNGANSIRVNFTQKQTSCTAANMTGTCTVNTSTNFINEAAICTDSAGVNTAAIRNSFLNYSCTVQVSSCPISIDPLNPAYSVPAGSPIGFDGKCPTARYNRVPITADGAAAKVAAYPPADPTPWVGPTRDAIDSGGQSAPAGITTTGPASQTGSPTTTTTTGGSPTQTITETKTPTYTYNYAGDTITYNTTTTTVTNNITTGVTTTTTTNGTTAAPQDPQDPCTANPDRIGCMTLGETPKDVVPKKNENLSFSTESVGLPSGCPADQVIAGKAFSYGPMCDAATSARPWVIVGGVFSALMLMLAAVRQI